MGWVEELVRLDGGKVGGWRIVCRGTDGRMVGGLVLGLDGK